MSTYWPRQSPGLPPGQRLLTRMPRFSDKPFAAPPRLDADFRVLVRVDREVVGEVTAVDLSGLDPREVTADFHCVTTWSVRDVRWTGVPLRRVIASLGLGETPAPFLVARGADHRQGHFVCADALAADVLVATEIDGHPLGARHGGPVRLVAPQHYGYKSIKHLTGLDFRTREPRHLGLEHLRGRVAYQERHPRLPSRLVALPYRLLIPPTAYAAERSLARSAPSHRGE